MDIFFNIIALNDLRSDDVQGESGSAEPAGANGSRIDLNVETFASRWSWDVVGKGKLDKEKHSFKTNEILKESCCFLKKNSILGISRVFHYLSNKLDFLLLAQVFTATTHSHVVM